MSTPAVPPVDTPALSEPERIIDTFIAPSKTFIDIRRNASWWVPWVIISVVSMMFWFVVDKKVGFDRITTIENAKSASASARLEKMNPDDRARMEGMQTTGYKVTLLYMGPIMVLLIMVVIAAVLMATFNFGMGAKVTFGQSMSINAYSMLPGTLMYILGAITLYAGADPDGFNMRSPVGSNLGYYIDPAHKVLAAFLSTFDVFSIWTVILLGMGFSYNSKVKRATAIGAVAALYVIAKLIGTAAVAIF